MKTTAKDIKTLMYNNQSHFTSVMDEVERKLIAAGTAGEQDIVVSIPEVIKDRVVKELQNAGFNVTLHPNIDKTDIAISWAELPF